MLRRNFKGDPIEIIYIEHVADDSDEDAHVSVLLPRIAIRRWLRKDTSVYIIV